VVKRIMQSAQEIFQDLLDRINEAMQAREFGVFADTHIVPYRLETFEGRLFLETKAELERLYGDLLAELDVLNVQRIESICSKAEFLDPDTISGFHETKLIVKGMHIMQSYFALSTLKRVDGAWRVASGQYAGPEKTLPHTVLGRYILERERALKDGS
jgi:hypothetical protein